MYDRSIQMKNLSQGYIMKETLEMLVDLFDVCFDSDGANDWMVERIEEKGHASDWNQHKAVHKLYDELKDKLDNIVRIKDEMQKIIMCGITYDKSLRYVLYECNSHRVGRCFLNFKDAFDVGLKKFGANNFYIELQADYGDIWTDNINIKTISKVTDFDKMKALSIDVNFNQNIDAYKTNMYYNEFIKRELNQVQTTI